MKDFNGKAYENYSSYKLCHKIFLEDIKNISPNIINSNKELIFNDIFDQIIKIAYRVNYNNQNEFKNIQTGLYENYKIIKNLSEKLPKIKSDSESGSGSDVDKNDPLKTLKKMEFDLVLKNVDGKYIDNYLKKMKDNNYQYINSFNIEKSNYYNLCFEIIISSKDVISKKIPQILKYAIFLNFLYDTYKVFQNLPKQQKIKFDKLINFFKDKFNFINLTNKTLLFIVSNGKKSDFDNMIESLKTKKDDIFIENLKNECLNKYNLYFNYSSYDPEKFKEEVTDKIYCIEEDKKNQIQEDKGDKVNLSEILEKMKKMEQHNQKIEEDNQKMKEDNQKMKEDNQKMKNRIINLENEIKDLKGGKKENEVLKKDGKLENINKLEEFQTEKKEIQEEEKSLNEKKDDEKKEK